MSLERLATQLRSLEAEGYAVRFDARHELGCAAARPSFFRRLLGSYPGCSCAWGGSRIVITLAPPAPPTPAPRGQSVTLVHDEWFYSTKGFSLTEVLVSTVIGMSLVGVMATFLLSSAKLSAGLVEMTRGTLDAQTRLARCAGASSEWRTGTEACADVLLEIEEEITGPFSGLVCGTFRLSTTIGSSGRSLSVVQHEPTCLAVWSEFAPLVPESEEDR